VRKHVIMVGAVLLACGGAAQAQSTVPGGIPPPPGMSLDRSAAMRFPQPVQVGTLLRRDVLQPVPSQRVLGTVRSVVRDENGAVEAVVEYGSFLGFGARPIAVPIDAMVLLGQDMEIVAYGPKQLSHFPTFSATGTTPLPSDAIIRVGLAKPSH
jgi:Flp pilus assembly pilin Flp